ncbi:uncharacterized protein LOC127877624 isoform X2 [Dreissena polymorpha]|uniref:Uncharacterized protein n=2 Tax=Dreissena polymorpha TaxID=45954 RepID=A0A9D4QNP6_DREPO|nr:uncharacterized protein LOC127877624 isoform X2 [Dreissena polymorpha]XP_052279654.1 uncharacterized protein LOC127877624 isoform X2 [Dreissena polymorpha]XP_052279655.1 uncharacterized protein LOC127877624 isoform X2 [Dreissena polymorpha]KAH3837719.1 hypothetical protein DPMN_111120 [Dreissena polymorpha]
MENSITMRSLRVLCLEALSRRSTLKTLLICLVITTCLHFIINFEQIREHGDYKSLDLPLSYAELRDYEPLHLTHFETFPRDGPVKIPRIIHQTWKNTEIPRKLIGWVKSWLKNNPGYEYWLWTDESARALIQERHAWLLDTYDNYPENIRRADALRYVILYEFGGIYADMDVESLKNLDPMLRKYSCFVPQEPYEHPILYGNFEHLVINAVMGCREKHPFMKSLMENLPYFSHMWNVLDSTGPHFLTNMYKQYTHKHGDTNPMDSNAVYLAPAEYFFPTIDPSKHFWFRIQCSNFGKLTKIQKRACVSLKRLGGKRKPLNVSFTDHHWIHTYLDFRLSLKGPVDIHSVVPSVKIYKNTSFS